MSGGAERSFRWANSNDHLALGGVMFDAVRNGQSLYSEAQRKAWVPEPRSGAEWSDRLSRQDIIIAEAADRIVGFMSLADGGYIDFAFIRPEAQRTGLFRQMFEQIHNRARTKGHALLWVHASLMAEPAFTALGFTIRKRENVALGAERFDRFEMEMPLSA